MVWGFGGENREHSPGILAGMGDDDVPVDGDQ